MIECLLTLSSGAMLMQGPRGGSVLLETVNLIAFMISVF